MVKSLANTQEKFWKGVFGIKYKSRNESTILKTSNKFFFKKCLKKTQKNKIKSMIEFGPNIGLNIIALQKILKLKKIRGVEINKIAYENLAKLKDVEAINKSVSSYKSKNKYDLVLSKGFLIHINPNQLNQTYKNIYNSCSANGYILIAEYYSPKPVAIDYRGNKNVLFKRDFATEMLKIFKKKINLIDYGFAYHGDKHPQDDLTWFLFKKNG
jgi:pseudaminic acid biosynthesis-associated methylase